MGWFKPEPKEEPKPEPAQKPEPEVYASMMFRKRATGTLRRFRCIEGKGWQRETIMMFSLRWENISSSELFGYYELAVERKDKVSCDRCDFSVVEPSDDRRCSAKIKADPDYVNGGVDTDGLPYCQSVNPDGNCPYFKAKRSHRATRRTPKRKD